MRVPVSLRILSTRAGSHLTEERVGDWSALALIGVYLALQLWVLPRLGVPT